MTQTAIATKQAPQMIRYDAACKALAAAKAIDEVQDVRNQADAIRVYAMQAKNKSLEVDAAEIRIRAERRLGQLIGEQKKGEGLNPGVRMAGKEKGGSSVVVSHDHRETPTLAESGISKDLSSRAQKLAAVPAEVFEAEVGDWRGRVQAENTRVTTRLEKAGERADRGHDDGPDLAELVDDLQAENTRLTALMQAAQASNQVAETIKWRAAYDRALTAQSEAMDAATRSEKREKFTKKQLMRCGKAVGEDDPTKIAPAVEALARRLKSCK